MLTGSALSLAFFPLFSSRPHRCTSHNTHTSTMSKAILLATLLPALAVLAQVGPSEPAPGNVYNSGSTCEIAWTADTSGQWTTLNIQLMSGSNTQMVHLTSMCLKMLKIQTRPYVSFLITAVATLDGTKDTSFSYTCPSVSLFCGLKAGASFLTRISFFY